MGTMAIIWEEVMSEEINYEAKYIERTAQLVDTKNKLNDVKLRLREAYELLSSAQQKLKILERKENE
jgi:hypothetical protein|tara:strand:+ start:308 stop:508 length:201 start_codon:yes stop_codon:yes gene_type:complete